MTTTAPANPRTDIGRLVAAGFGPYTDPMTWIRGDGPDAQVIAKAGPEFWQLYTGDGEPGAYKRVANAIRAADEARDFAAEAEAEIAAERAYEEHLEHRPVDPFEDERERTLEAHEAAQMATTNPPLTRCGECDRIYWAGDEAHHAYTHHRS